MIVRIVAVGVVAGLIAGALAGGLVLGWRPQTAAPVAFPVTVSSASDLGRAFDPEGRVDRDRGRHRESSPHRHRVFAATGATAALASLPEARYDAVIPGLDAPRPKRFGREPSRVFTLDSDVALYGADREHPAARLAAHNFLGEPTVVLGYPPRRDGWVLILTPARQRLPSDGPASAQSYAWVRAAALPPPVAVRARIEISVTAQTLTVWDGDDMHRFSAGVGRPGTPTPTGVTGYLQARYLDPAQGQSRYAIQLTSLHATAADEPYGGDDGGLIGIHFGVGRSHGCIRLSAEAIAAIDALPIGTPVIIK